MQFRLVVAAIGLMIVFALGLALFWTCGHDNVLSGLTAQYIGNQRCAQCHQQLAARWSLSYHARAMALADPQSVLGDFNNVDFRHFDIFSRFFKHQDEFWIFTDWDIAEKGEPKLQDLTPKGIIEQYSDNCFRIKYVLGIYPLQQYLVEFSDGRVQCLPTAWDVNAKRWYHIYADEKIPVGDVLHWRQPAQNWNYMCASCHTTNFQRNFDPVKNCYHSQFTEINNGCESCHGPGSLHERIAVANPKTGRDKYYGSGLFNFPGANSDISSSACAYCHARRQEIYPGFTPGQRFSDFYFPELLDSDAFYPDGQIKDEDFDYTSFKLSRFAMAGGTCYDCHKSHIGRIPHLKYNPNNTININSQSEHTVNNSQSELTNSTDDIDFIDSFKPVSISEQCMLCHDSAKYDTPKHHFHDASKDIAGTRCEDCHMPARTYMGTDLRRDHYIQSPNPQLTIDLGVPNACNGCHKDVDKGETAQWAQQYLDQWYGKKTNQKPHFAYAIAGGRAGKPEAEQGLAVLVRDQQRSEIVRASAAALLGRYSGPMAESALKSGLKDSSELVVTASIRSLESKWADPAEMRSALQPLLAHESRAVRMEAARSLTAVGITSESATPVGGNTLKPEVPSIQKSFERALTEFLQGQEYLSDQPASWLNRGVVYENLGETAKAESLYQQGLKLFPDFFPLHNNTAMLSYRLGKLDLAQAQFREITQRFPENPEGWYSLGLLLAEQLKTLSEAADCFQKAAELTPSPGQQSEDQTAVVPVPGRSKARIYYNLGLARQQLKQIPLAEQALKTAVELEPNNPDFVYALVCLYRQENNVVEALKWESYLNRIQHER